MMKKIIRNFLIFFFIMAQSSFCANITATLDSADGTSAFLVNDSGNTTVTTIDSDGNLGIEGNMGIGLSSPLAHVHIKKTTAALRIENDTSANSYLRLRDTSHGHADIFKYNSGAGNVELDLNADPSDDTSNSYIRLFRSVTTAGEKALELFVGDGTPTLDGVIRVDGGDSCLQLSGGNFGFGTASPGASLEVDGNTMINTDLNIKGGLRLDSGGVFCTTAEMLIVDGKVGIGTTNPGASLEVNGGDSSFAWGGDHTSSNYIRLGDMQICWGSYTAGTWNNPQTITYPVAFTSAPTVTTSCPRSNYYTTVGTGNTGPTTTDFDFYICNYSDSSAPGLSTTGHWIAIGPWQ